MSAVPPARRRLRRLGLVAVLTLVVPACGTELRPAARTVPGQELDAATIPELQEQLESGELTAVDLTESYLERIDALDGDLGAVLRVNEDAVAEAKESDRVRAESGPRSALEGIPVLLKDNVDTAGLPTTAGSNALLGSRPDDATITRRLRDAGAVIIGKANLSEWANFRGENSTSGWSAVGGQTNNPYVLDRNPCGSSSGSAAGVAASLAQVAVGTETDGSIVCPSGQTGVVGLKPTLGLVSRDGIVPISAEQDTAGPIARHTVDAAILLSVLAGADPADAATAETPADLDADFADLDTDELEGARIGVWELSAEQSEAVDDVTEDVYTRAVKELEAAGATTVPVSLPFQQEIGDGELPALLAEFHRDIDAYLAATPGDHPADLAGLVEFNAQDPAELKFFGQELFEQALAAPLPADDPAVRQTRNTIRDLARRSIDETLAQGPGPGDDLVAIVGLTNTPGWITRYFSEDEAADEFVYSTSGPAAVAGYPSVTVPAGFAGPQEALPVGISFIGTRWDDADLLDLAAAFETADPARRAPEFLATVGD
ncbi:amidase [Geodermatophilus sp. URMC 64]